MELSEIRKELDVIDKKIIDLYFTRMDLCKKVAEYKIANNMPVLDGVREKQKLDNVSSNAESEFDKESLREIFQLLMDRSKMLQTDMMNNK